MNETFPWDISFEGPDTVQTHNFANVPMFHILYFAFYLGIFVISFIFVIRIYFMLILI